jgi:hypothetical protein
MPRCGMDVRAASTLPDDRSGMNTMSSAAVSAGRQIRSRPTRSVVAVSGDSERPELLDMLLFDANECDVIFVDSIAHAYSRIKQVTPYLVVVLSEIDDVAACQLLSMLKVDDSLSGMLVVTCATGGTDCNCEDIGGELLDDTSFPTRAIEMN